MSRLIEELAAGGALAVPATNTHRLMDYNNDPATTLADVHSLFREAVAQIK